MLVIAAVAIIILENSSDKTFDVTLGKQQWTCAPNQSKTFPVDVGTHTLTIKGYGERGVEVRQPGKIISIDLAVFVPKIKQEEVPKQEETKEPPPNKGPPQKLPTPKSNQAVVVVLIPESGTVYFDEVPFEVEDRKDFNTPNKLTPGKEYHYCVRYGKEKRKVSVYAGTVVIVDFRKE